MKGKVAFVLGAAVGYVLGSRAGRARYEQIKSGALAVWNSPSVQKGVDSVRDAVDDRVGDLKSAAVQAGKDAFASLTGNGARSRQTPAESAGASASDEARPSGGAQASTGSGASRSTQSGKAQSGKAQSGKAQSGKSQTFQRSQTAGSGRKASSRKGDEASEGGAAS